MSLVKELYGQTFAYDDKNNVTSTVQLTGEKSQMEYDAFDNLVSYIQPGRAEAEKYTMTFGDTDEEKKRHLPRTAKTPTGILTETAYDAYGNALEVKTRQDGQDAPFMKARTAYTADGNYAVASTNARGQTVATDTDPDKGLVRSATDPVGQGVVYTYDGANRVTEAKTAVDTREYKNTYTYEKDRIKTVSHNTTGNTPDVTYTFSHDAFGNQTTVKVGTQPLSTNIYSDSGDKLLQRVEYGNGGKVHYTYDAFKRTKGIRYDEATDPRFVYEYGANGAVGNVKDAELNREARVSYDTAERPVTAEQLENGKRTYHLLQRYNRYNQPSILKEEAEQLNNLRGLYETEADYDVESRPTSLTYRSSQTKDPELIRMGQLKYVPTESIVKGVLHLKTPEEPQEVYAEYTVPAPLTEVNENPTQRKLTYAYDMLGRLKERTLYADEAGTTTKQVLQTQYRYLDGGHGAGSTTGLVDTIVQGDREMHYQYDAVGNILREGNFDETQLTLLTVNSGRLPLEFGDGASPLILAPTGTPEKRTYGYDALGQLTRADDLQQQTTWTYHYDQGGNLLEKKRYGYTTADDLSGLASAQDIAYTYGDANWKDKLTAYDGKLISYDAIGNPLSYDGWTYTWKTGRMLHSMTKAGTNAQFTYDHTGLRVKKTVNGVDTFYTLNGKNITHLRKDNTQMHFYYDAQGRPSLVRYNGVDYAYLHNLQGDITGIVDMAGQIVVEYGYDPWGKILHRTGSMAETLGIDNPLRYRGYVYDEETGYYVTATRYYNPEWGRFINPDTLLGRTGNLLSNNSFAYCRNNPAVYTDSEGMEEEYSYFIAFSFGNQDAWITLIDPDMEVTTFSTGKEIVLYETARTYNPFYGTTEETPIYSKVKSRTFVHRNEKKEMLTGMSYEEVQSSEIVTYGFWTTKRGALILEEWAENTNRISNPTLFVAKALRELGKVDVKPGPTAKLWRSTTSIQKLLLARYSQKLTSPLGPMWVYWSSNKKTIHISICAATMTCETQRSPAGRLQGDCNRRKVKTFNCKMTGTKKLTYKKTEQWVKQIVKTV